MLPQADDIITRARETANRAAARLAAAQARTRTGILAIGVLMVVLGLGFSFLIGLSITRPLNGLVRAMKRLAEGDTDGRIPATNARDEIGDMARTVIVFRDTMIERERLAAAQSEESRAREQRSSTISLTIGAVQEFGRERARQAARGVDEAGDELLRPQQGGRYGDLGSRRRRAARQRRLRQRDGGRRLGRGTGHVDRRDRLAGGQVHRRRPARGVGSRAHGHHHEPSWAMPPPASARWSG